MQINLLTSISYRYPEASWHHGHLSTPAAHLSGDTKSTSTKRARTAFKQIPKREGTDHPSQHTGRPGGNF